MKKLFLTLALLSLTSLAFAGCVSQVEEQTPATDDSSAVVEPTTPAVDESAMLDEAAPADDSAMADEAAPADGVTE